MANINDPQFDEPREHPGFRALRARLSRQAGSERLFRLEDAVDYHEGEQPPDRE